MPPSRPDVVFEGRCSLRHEFPNGVGEAPSSATSLTSPIATPDPRPVGVR